MRLDSDPEYREYYFDCPECGKLLLDKGLQKEIKYNKLNKMKIL